MANDRHPKSLRPPLGRRAAATTEARSAADRLVDITLTHAKLFHTREGEAFARYLVNSHREVFALASSEFRTWLEAQYFATYRRGATRANLDEAITTLAARARHEGAQRRVHLRTAKRKGKYYLDLCDSRWRVAEIDSEGWRILEKSPVAFTRKPAMRALPKPIGGGMVGDIFRFTNFAVADQTVVLAWLVACLRPETPYPGLALLGPEGSAKSTSQRVLRDLIDPSIENLRAKPRSVGDLYVTAGNGHLLSLENLSKLPDEMQDAMCSVLTGAGASTRKLYTNDQEHLLSVKRPIVANGISQFVTRPDLLDRFVMVQMPLIAENRRPEAELLDAFKSRKPILFGALLTLFSRALALLPQIKKEDLALPRMADFAQLGEAVSRSLHRPVGEFIKRMARRHRADIERELDNDPAAAAIRSYVTDNEDGLHGLYADVSKVLREYAIENSLPHDAWPMSGKAFGEALRRLQAGLGKVGIVVDHGERTTKGYRCRIRRAGSST